jgi:tRNA wybutosine-synthesizing protein 2
MRAAVVQGRRADELLDRLRSEGLLDRTVRITKRGHEVVIPLLRDPDFPLDDVDAHLADVVGLPDRPVQRTPQEVLAERFREAGLPQNVVPSRWQRIGDIVVLRLSEEARPHEREIGRILGATLGARTVVEDRSGIHGPFRLPDIRVLWGAGTETIHTEGGVRFALDVARVMFSSGNLAERLGTPSRIRPRQVVVDLFAGIGYFTIPIAVRSEPACVYACEANPIAYRYLAQNLRLNRTANVVPLLGDCRSVAPAGVADWVLMGHFSAADYLDVAFRSIKQAGTIVYHHLSPAGPSPGDAADVIRLAAHDADFDLQRIRSRRVKSYAPRILHGVMEADVVRKPKGISRANPSPRR